MLSARGCYLSVQGLRINVSVSSESHVSHAHTLLPKLGSAGLLSNHGGGVGTRILVLCEL